VGERDVLEAPSRPKKQAWLGKKARSARAQTNSYMLVVKLHAALEAAHLTGYRSVLDGYVPLPSPITRNGMIT